MSDTIDSVMCYRCGWTGQYEEVGRDPDGGEICPKCDGYRLGLMFPECPFCAGKNGLGFSFIGGDITVVCQCGAAGPKAKTEATALEGWATPTKELHQWQRYAAYCNSCAKSGENNPSGFEEFILRWGPE